jgi:hypothetical protein
VDLTTPYGMSLGLGIGFGLVYGIASYLTYRLALNRAVQTFMMIAFGGMILRLFAAVIAVVLVLVLTEVQPLVFVSSFFAVFAMALTVEVLVIHRQQSRKALQRSA